jgi:murein DD-endopeptidase MepM/ murein hydrolase activator NlpD
VPVSSLLAKHGNEASLSEFGSEGWKAEDKIRMNAKQLVERILGRSAFWKKMGWGGVAFLAIAVGWQSTLSPPDVQSYVPFPGDSRSDVSSTALSIDPVAVEPHIDYPDSFGFRSEYLDQFLIKRRTVRRGDTLYSIFREFGLPEDCLDRGLSTCDVLCKLNKLHPGDELTIYARREDRQAVKLVYSTADEASYVFRRSRQGDHWECRQEEGETIALTQAARGAIRDNLYDSCVRAGLPAKLVVKFADLFAYDVDFATDLRKGNQFAVYFKQEVRNGKRVEVGPILAARIEIDGKAHEVFRFRHPDGAAHYYDAQGRGLHRRFLKAPLQYSRISSNFTYRRFHPILKIYRPHLGIDYAAPTGTPVSAIGRGRITHVGTKGGYGRFVEITHDDTFKSTYGHLSRYAGNLKKGSVVKQGQVIGYVGSTGLATGPHLDFRFYENGKPVDFLDTRFPHSQILPESLKAEFQRKRQEYVAVLEGGRRFARRDRFASTDE